MLLGLEGLLSGVLRRAIGDSGVIRVVMVLTTLGLFGLRVGFNIVTSFSFR